MSDSIIIKVPTISDFSEVEVIEVLISPGDNVAIESPLITLESDKASMDIPSPVSGQIVDVMVRIGDWVSEGSPIARVENLNPAVRIDESRVTSAPIESLPKSEISLDETESRPEPTTTSEAADFEVDLVVIGSGPGGYTAAFRAADLGLDTVLVERDPTLGGVCLNVGCIPSKTLLHVARVIEETKELQAAGLDFDPPVINLERLRSWKEKVVGQLTEGLTTLAKQRKVTIIQGEGRFVSGGRIIVRIEDEDAVIDFRHAIIATGSEPVLIPDLPDDDRIMDSTRALDLTDIPERLLVIGGGIIGLELATVYHALGSRITIVEMLNQLMFGADKDLLRPLQKRLQNQCDNIFLGTRVVGIEAHPDHLMASFEGPKGPSSDRFDRVLVAVGRSPQVEPLQVEAAGVVIDSGGFIPVDTEQRTNVPHIFAIGDIVGQPMLAHKATHEGKVAAEVAAGHKSGFDARIIPSVAYTDPEIAWAGLTENEAQAQGIAYDKGVFPWAASGRALSLGRSEGLTKLLFDPTSKRVLGAGIVGVNAGDLIAEACLAIEMGCEAEDISLVIHPHPTLSETIASSAEAFQGTITDLYLLPKK
jgi:dihydrolipoamide dehydrogenase